MSTATMNNPHQSILESYRDNFKHLRLLKGVAGLSGEMILEAETPDGRYLNYVLTSSESDTSLLKQVLEDWSPKEKN